MQLNDTAEGIHQWSMYWIGRMNNWHDTQQDVNCKPVCSSVIFWQDDNLTTVLQVLMIHCKQPMRCRICQRMTTISALHSTICRPLSLAEDLLTIAAVLTLFCTVLHHSIWQSPTCRITVATICTAGACRKSSDLIISMFADHTVLGLQFYTLHRTMRNLVLSTDTPVSSLGMIQPKKRIVTIDWLSKV